MRISNLPKLVLPALLLLGANAAQAEISVFTNRDAYLGSVGSTGIDRFNDLAIQPELAPLSRTAGSFSYQVDTVGSSPWLIGATDDRTDFWLSVNNRLDKMIFSNFSGEAAGVGGYFFGTNIAGGSTRAREIVLTATDSFGEVLTYSLRSPTVSSFIGFVSTGEIVSLMVSSANQPGVFATANDLHISSPIPEPSSAGMLLGGLGLLAAVARRRRRG